MVAEEWFKKFTEQLPSDEGVEILRDLFDERGNWGTDAQWTHVMSVFLMKLARKMGYFQECGKIDFVWYKGDSINPSILIEHENDYEGIFEGELPKLLQERCKKCELRILITYTWVDEREIDKIRQVREEILERVCSKIRELRIMWSGEFLLIIGDSSATEADIEWDKYWHGYILNQSGQVIKKLPEESY